MRHPRGATEDIRSGGCSCGTVEVVATVSEAETRLDLYRSLAPPVRADSIRCSTAAGSGHPTSSLSAADLMAVLQAGHLRYDFDRPEALADRPPPFFKGPAPSALSAADLMAVLQAGHLRYDFDRPESLANDHLIFSKGHASPLVYAMF